MKNSTSSHENILFQPFKTWKLPEGLNPRVEVIKAPIYEDSILHLTLLCLSLWTGEFSGHITMNCLPFQFVWYVNRKQTLVTARATDSFHWKSLQNVSCKHEACLLT
jgi:hypothetical protein